METDHQRDGEDNGRGHNDILTHPAKQVCEIQVHCPVSVLIYFNILSEINSLFCGLIKEDRKKNEEEHKSDIVD
jgi:hypothetical protein